MSQVDVERSVFDCEFFPTSCVESNENILTGKSRLISSLIYDSVSERRFQNEQ